MGDWGPHVWHSLHSFAYAAPAELDAGAQRDWMQLLTALSRLMPCKRCADHFKGEIQKTFPDGAVGDRANLIRGINRIHNAVNVRRGKRTYSLPQHYRLYESPKWDFVISFEEIVATVTVLAVAALLSSEFRKRRHRHRGGEGNAYRLLV